jgi:hypothetical protein
VSDGLYHDDTITLDAAYNWWGAANGAAVYRYEFVNEFFKRITEGGYGEGVEIDNSSATLTPALTAPPFAGCPTLPAPPGNLNVEVIPAQDANSAEVQLSWTDNATDETEYIILREDQDVHDYWERFTKIVLPTNTQTYIDTVPCDGRYTYDVMARNGTTDLYSAYLSVEVEVPGC